MTIITLAEDIAVRAARSMQAMDLVEVDRLPVTTAYVEGLPPPEPGGEIIMVASPYWNGETDAWVDTPPTMKVGSQNGVRAQGINTLLSVEQTMRMDIEVLAPDGTVTTYTGIERTVSPFGVWTWEFKWVCEQIGTYTAELVLYAG